MTVVDSSVWIDLLKDRTTPEVSALQVAIRSEIIVGDLVLMEVLQGSRNDAAAATIADALGKFVWQEMAGLEVAQQAARHYRILHTAGVTPRSQIDLIIATFCVMYGHDLLHADRDFDVMAPHIRLSLVIPPARLH